MLKAAAVVVMSVGETTKSQSQSLIRENFERKK